MDRHRAERESMVLFGATGSHKSLGGDKIGPAQRDTVMSVGTELPTSEIR
jgi:hypothetical protein